MRRQLWTAVVRQRKLNRQLLRNTYRSLSVSSRDATIDTASNLLRITTSNVGPQHLTATKAVRRFVSTSNAVVEPQQQHPDEEHISSVTTTASSSYRPASSLPHRLSTMASFLDTRFKVSSSSSVWSTRLRLAQSPDRQRAIAVLGDGRSADARGLVSSLLIDPFSEEVETRRLIEQRRYLQRSGAASDDKKEDVFRIRAMGRAGQEPVQTVSPSSTTSDELTCDAPFLRECQAEILEVGDSNTSQALTTLLTAPICVLALDPVRLLDTPLLREILPELAGKPHVYLVVNRSSVGHGGVDAEKALKKEIDEELKKQWDAFIAASGSPLPTIFHLDSSSALAALSALSTGLETPGDPSSGARAESFKRFSERYAASGMGDFYTEFKQSVKRALEGQASVVTERGTLPGASIVESHVLDRARHWAETQLANLAQEADEVMKASQKFERLAARTVDSLMQSTNSASSTLAISPESIEASLSKAKSTIRQVLQDRLAWWKVLFWRVDQVADEVGMEVQGRWGFTLAQQMAFVAGRLESTRLELERAVDRTLRTSPKEPASPSPSPFHSAILLNELDQISSRSAIDPSSLLHPIESRRDQLLEYSVPTLQRRAHQMTWTTLSLVFLSSSLSWSAVIPLELVTAPTGLAVALLGSLGSLRWAAGRWSKAQSSFWKDWQRVEEGVEDDLREGVKEALQGRVMGKVARAIEARKGMGEKRLAEIEAIAKELRSI